MQEKTFSIYSPILGDRATISRRYCLSVSLIALFIGLTETIPQQLPLIGLNFESNDTIIIKYFLFSITLLVLIDFLCHAIPDRFDFITKYRFHYHGPDRENIVKSFQESIRQGLSDQLKSASAFQKTEIEYQIKEAVYISIQKHYQFFLTFLLNLRMFIEVFAPMIANVIALCSLFLLPVQQAQQSEETYNPCIASIAVNASGGQDKVIHFQNSLTLSHIEQSTVTLVLDTSTCTVQHIPHPTTTPETTDQPPVNNPTQPSKKMMPANAVIE